LVSSIKAVILIQANNVNKKGILYTLMETEKEILEAINAEIREIKKQSDYRKAKIESIELLHKLAGRWIYLFKVSKKIRFSPDQPILLKSKNTEKVIYYGVIVSSDKYNFVAAFDLKLPNLNSLNPFIEWDPSFILKGLRKLLFNDLWIGSENAAILLSKQIRLERNRKIANINISNELNDTQTEAVNKTFGNTFSIIWGPPGTGKTRTLGYIISQCLHHNYSCLMLSTSNVAVDEMLKSAISASPQFSDEFLRWGTPIDPKLEKYTARYKALRNNPKFEAKLDDIDKEEKHLKQVLRHYHNSKTWSPEVKSSLESLNNISQQISAIENEIMDEITAIAYDSNCIAATLAALFVNHNLSNLSFDILIIDEVSMVPLVNLLCAVKISDKHVIFAGDPMQLPPIVLNNSINSKRWMGTNVFKHLNINEPTSNDIVTYLNKQYRMDKDISEMVSNTGYNGTLHSKKAKSNKGEIVTIDLKAREFYSVKERTYYNPTSLMLTCDLLSNEKPEYDTVLLSPFRGQEKLFHGLALDLDRPAIHSSTIHQSQGSERDVVVLDLTIHTQFTQQAFFRNAAEAKRLINVALSRAKSKLIVICNFDLLSSLGSQDSYFLKLKKSLESYKINYQIDSNSQLLAHYTNLNNDLFVQGDSYCYASTGDEDGHLLDEIVSSSIKYSKSSPLFILRKDQSLQNVNGVIQRTAEATSVPKFLSFGGNLYIRHQNAWWGGYLPNTAELFTSLATSYLYDDKYDIESDGLGFICNFCNHGMELKYFEKTYFMVCTSCRRKRRVSYKDVQILIDLNEVCCHNCNVKMTPRVNSFGEMFCGCPNYPRCRATKPLSYLADRNL